jgi:hypothetical protein
VLLAVLGDVEPDGPRAIVTHSPMRLHLTNLDGAPRVDELKQSEMLISVLAADSGCWPMATRTGS